MVCRRIVIGIAGWAAGFAFGPAAFAQNAVQPVAARNANAVAPNSPAATSSSRIPIDKAPAEVRDRVQSVVERPTLRTRGPVEVFNCQPEFYFWLLDHPDLAVRLWRALGVPCADIQKTPDGRFGWQDGQGSSIRWSTIVTTTAQRVWYAEGQVKPGPLLPATTIRAVISLQHREGKDEDGRPAIRHQAELNVQTDSRVMALAARLFGASAPHLAEQYAGQIQTFYAGLAWHFDQDPDKARTLLNDIKRPGKSVSDSH